MRRVVGPLANDALLFLERVPQPIWVEDETGDVIYSNGESHIGENIGTTPTQVIMVEMKEPKP